MSDIFLANVKDPEELQQVLLASPGYSLRTSGQLPTKSAADEMLAALPPNFSLENKYVFLLKTENETIGCVDILRGFPERGTAMLGLLLLREEVQGRGLGKASFAAVEKFLRNWPEVKKVRIGVVAANSGVLPFWKARGFVDTGLRRPYEEGTVKSETTVLEKAL